MKKIIITQRFEKIGMHDEFRDNLDINMCDMLSRFGFIPVLLPNKILNLKKFIKKINPSGFILTGGGDPLKKDLRLKNEFELIKYSISKHIPILGICRGAQVLNIFNGGKVRKVKNHVKVNHKIYGPLVNKSKIFVNSYHDYGFDKNILGNNLKILAYTIDGTVKCFTHNKYKMLGMMWHPERYKKYKKFDSKIIKNFF